MLWRCPENCAETRITPRSCGHRSCPLCQTEWLTRQRDKLLPVDYFMVTFTLPAELRQLAQAEPHAVYSALFSAASQTIQGFGTRKLKAELGQCAVLHTHNRRLDLHPHVHIIVTGGGIDAKRKQWKKLKGKYLFNAFALAKVFRAKLRLKLVQLVLRVVIKAHVPVPRPVLCCPHCQRPMQIVLITSRRRPDG